MSIVREKLTPPVIARHFGVTPNKVLNWIKSGQLAATNVASDPAKQPRFVVDAAEVERFELARKVAPTS